MEELTTLFIVYECPFCHYYIHDIEYLAAEYDFYCPKCRQKRLSSFHRVDMYHGPELPTFELKEKIDYNW